MSFSVLIPGVPAPVEAAQEKAGVAAMTDAEYKAHLKQIAESVDSLFKLHDRVSELKAGEVLTAKVGADQTTQIDKSSLRSMKTDICNQIKDLYKFRKAHAKAKRVKAADGEEKTRNNGFDNPVYVSQHVVNFFTQNQASLSLDPVTKRAVAALVQSLSTKHLTTSTILTMLWSIYALHTQRSNIIAVTPGTDSKGKPKEVQYYHADQNMKTCFGPSGSNTFAYLATKERKDGKAIPPFNPENFHYTGWQSIFAHNKCSEVGQFPLTAEQATNLKHLTEWKALAHKKEALLTAEDKLIIQCVNTRQFAPSLNNEQKQRVQVFVQAKSELDQLQAEKVAVKAVLEAHKAAAPEAPKKTGRGKKAAAASVAAPVANGFIPVAGMQVPHMK